MVSVQDRVNVVQSESLRLSDYLAALPSDAWTQPSACDLWEIRDVVGHLVWVAEFFGDTISRGVRGDSSILPDRPPGDAIGEQSFDAYIARTATARRNSLGEELLATFGTRWDEVIQLMLGLGLEDWEKPCAFWRGGTVPAQFFFLQSMQELAVHSWDIRSALEASAPFSQGSLLALMERIPRRFSLPQLARFCLSPGLPRTARFRFQVTGAVSANDDLIVQDDKCRMEPADQTAADVIFKCDTDTFVLLMYRRLTLDPAIAAGRLAVDGDLDLTAAFKAWLEGN